MNAAGLFIKRNASTILTCIGGVGVVATSLMAVKATPKALLRLEEAKEEKGEELTVLEKVTSAGTVYIPSVLVGVGTLACLFGANVMNKRQQASLTSAYALLNASFKEYKNKVDELYGEGSDKEIEEAIFEDHQKDRSDEITLFYDEYSGRFFESTMFKVQKAEYFFNRELMMKDYVYLNEWYELLEIPCIDEGWDLGWSTCMCLEMYWQPWVDFSHSVELTEDGREYRKIGFFGEPMENFEDYC